LQQLVQKLDIRIVDQQQKVVFNEQRNTDFCGKINLVSDEFQAYDATLGISLKNGEFMQQKVNFYAGKRIEYILFSDGNRITGLP